MADVLVFTRDLRVHDNPALRAAAAATDGFVALFVLDPTMERGLHDSPNRRGFLVESLRDLDASLRAKGTQLHIVRGRPDAVVPAIAAAVTAERVHMAADVTPYALARDKRLATALGRTELVLHQGITVLQPGAVTPVSRDHYAVFTPYMRRWVDHARRPVLKTPAGVVKVALPAAPGVDLIAIGDLENTVIAGAQQSPQRQVGGEQLARARFQQFLDEGLSEYAAARDTPSIVGTSRLSADLHFGCLSPLEVVERAQNEPGGEDFVRQLCWRDFHHQLTASHGDIHGTAYRPRGDDWRADHEGFAAWCEGRTGFPLVDAGMRELLETGFMHNRVRMVAASLLAKDLRIDWRWGARHFMRWLVDGDVVNNGANWQWVAGTGSDTRPNRIYNPVTQSKRFDKDGTYIRTFVPELAGMAKRDIHAPWLADALPNGYPPPLVDHADAVERFRAERER